MIRDLRIVKDAFWALALCGLVAAVFRLWFGLGETTNLSDSVPWGLWKVFNMVAGVALSTSGFTIGFLVYVLGLERFRPLVKPAILIAFLGYGCSCTALLFDIGLPHRFWHPILMWNHHSFLFEVFWCVLLYFTVTTIELLPTLFERFRAERAARWLHRITFGVVVLGISLSSLHHSSLGSLFLVTPLKLHPLWYSSALPVFFILSAMGAGILVVVLMRILYAWFYDPEPVFGPSPTGAACVLDPSAVAALPPRPRGLALPMLRNLTWIGASILGVYFVLKVVDLVISGDYVALFAGTWESYLFALELLITAPLPIALLLLPRTRNSPVGLAFVALSAVAGLILNRLDVGIFGYFWAAEQLYVPSLAEWAVGLGVVAAAGLVFLAVAENFTIFDDGWKERRLSRGVFRRTFDTLSGVWNVALQQGLPRVTIISVFVIPLSWVAMYPLYAQGQNRPVRPSIGVDATRTSLRIDGNRSGFSTLFPHQAHRERMGGEEGCVTCHHASLPGDHATPCSRCHGDMIETTSIFDHHEHLSLVAASEELSGLHPTNQTCVHCHQADGPECGETAASCLACHEEDIWGNRTVKESPGLAHAVGFVQAMHDSCIPCHEQEAAAQDRPELGECSNCHESLRTLDEESQ